MKNSRLHRFKKYSATQAAKWHFHSFLLEADLSD